MSPVARAHVWALFCYVRIIALFIMALFFIRWSLSLGLPHYFTVLPEWSLWVLVTLAVLRFRCGYSLTRRSAHSSCSRYWLHRSEPKHIGASVEMLCDQRDLQLPRIYIAPTDHKSTTSLLDDLQRPDILWLEAALIHSLEPAELRAIIAHELRHSDALDVKITMLTKLMRITFSSIWFWGGITFLLFGHQGWGETLWRFVWGCGLFLLFHIVTGPICLAMHRAMEYKADILACADIRDPGMFLQALAQIDRRGFRWERAVPARQWDLAERFEEWLETFISTHPSYLQRKRAIERVFGPIDVWGQTVIINWPDDTVADPEALRAVS